ncbi:MAG: ATP-binding protein [Rubrivivax sp.]
MRSRGRSIGRRLLATLVLVSAGYWVVMAAWTLRDSVATVNEIFDAHLAQMALALLRVTDPDDADPTTLPQAPSRPPGLAEAIELLPHLPQRLAQLGFGTGPAVAGSLHAMQQDYERQLRYQVFSGDGTLLLRSANAPAEAMARADGFSDDADGSGRPWRHFAVWDRHRDFRVVVSEAHDLRTGLVRRVATQAALPLALGLPVLLLLVWLMIRRGLDPLGVLAREIGSRRVDDLKPLAAEAAPQEVRPLVASLNALLERVTQTLERERRFTADAAHELRTPLAAMQAHLHLAQRTEGADRERAMACLRQGVERGSRVVSQLLSLARLDPEKALPDAQTVDLRPIAEEVCAELAPLAMARRQELEFDCRAAGTTLEGNADLLAMLLLNLVDNAIRYTPAGGKVTISLHDGDADGAVTSATSGAAAGATSGAATGAASSSAGLSLEVVDDGPGIPAAERERVFDRFFRLPGNEQPGTGLGLTICRRIAELHHAQIDLGDGPAGRGLAVRVRFPARRG